MSKSVDETLLERRSVRRYEREPIAADDLAFIRAAIRNTPTSYNGQQYSVIEVADPALRERFAEIVGQKQLKTAALDLAFLADFNKIAVAAKAKGLEQPQFHNTVDGLLVGTVDAALAMMSAIVAAESRGLGACPVGYARTVNPAAVSELFGLPDKVYLVCALAIGVPREAPDLKPKQPEDLLFFANRYGTEGMADKLLAYDAGIVRYHQTRSSNQSDEDWIGQMLGYYREGMGFAMRAALLARGFGMEK